MVFIDARHDTPHTSYPVWCYNGLVEIQIQERKVCIMKDLRAKIISMRTMMTAALAFAMLALVSFSQEGAVMAGGWSAFKKSMTTFFYEGLGGEGAQGIGIVIVVVGILLAIISFVVHKMNPQSRMPGWFTCLIVAFLGAMLFSGVGPIIKIIEWLRDTVLGWFGFSGFGTYST